MTARVSANQQARALLHDADSLAARVDQGGLFLVAEAQAWAISALAEALERVAPQLNTIARAVGR